MGRFFFNFKGTILLSLFFLAGCATTSTYQVSYAEEQMQKEILEKAQRKVILDTWIGQTEWSLVASWGRPVLVSEAGSVTEEYPEGEPRTLLYNRPRNMWMPGPTTTHVTDDSGMIGDAPYMGESITTDYSDSGKVENVGEPVRFTIDNKGIIKSYTDDGNYPIKPYDHKLDEEGVISYDRQCYIDKWKGDLDKAIIDCNKAIELIPDDAEAYSDLCNVYGAKGRGNSAEGLAACGKSIQLTDVGNKEGLQNYYHLEKYGSSRGN